MENHGCREPHFRNSSNWEFQVFIRTATEDYLETSLQNVWQWVLALWRFDIPLFCQGFPGYPPLPFCRLRQHGKDPGWIANLPPRCAQQLWPPCCQVGRCSRQLPLLEPNGLHFLLESKQCTIPIFQDGFDINVFQSHYRGSNPIIWKQDWTLHPSHSRSAAPWCCGRQVDLQKRLPAASAHTDEHGWWHL